MNNVNITGRISNDFELRKTNNNKSLLELSIAVNRERKGEVDFFKTVLWETKADYINSYAKKGTLIGVSGKLETNSYINKDGNKVYQTYILAEKVEILRQPADKNNENNNNFGGNRSDSYKSIIDDLDF